jgi:hypothetical protein
MACFGTQEFSVVVSRGSNLLLVQRFEYASPSDVLYHLLGICKMFSLLQEEVSLRVSGLVDKDSALAKELFQYFLDIDYRAAAWETDEEIFPPHFFTALNDLARCAS